MKSMKQTEARSALSLAMVGSLAGENEKALKALNWEPILSSLRLVLLALASLLAVDTFARTPQAPTTGYIVFQDLPLEARETLSLIKRGGPFPYRKDGSVFGNYERLLPAQPRGHYREYTVPTIGVRDRGARRIVAGLGETGNVRSSGEYYYTADHYRSFQKIRE